MVDTNKDSPFLSLMSRELSVPVKENHKKRVKKVKKDRDFERFQWIIKEVEGCKRFADGHSPDLQTKWINILNKWNGPICYSSLHCFQFFNYA